MTRQHKPSKAMNAALWCAQAILASSLLWSGTIKLFQPVEKLAAMWPWAAQVPATLLHFTGLVDLIVALGLVLPAFTRIKPQVTPIAAVGLILLMLSAALFHIARGEASVIGVNIAFALMAAFVAWGRWKKAPIPGTTN